MSTPITGVVHHIELWVPDLERAAASWGWLLGAMGYQPFQRWAAGRSWRLGDTYIVVEQSPAMRPGRHDRLRPGLNHLAFHVASPAQVEDLVARASRHGWTPLFDDRHPYAGGPEHYAGYLQDADGFEVELVAAPERGTAAPDASRGASPGSA